ncbi:MAG: DNA replication/repair protein RecF [Clostridia bacterium]|nr:DNA replication/repair protein RecF [Clostridia bacterium]
MRVLEHHIKNFRNISDISFEPDEGINVIYGENGHGKTNIIESIWLFTGCNSFRTRKNNELINEHSKEAELNSSFFAFNREQEVKLKIGDKKEVHINGIKKNTHRQLLGEFQAVVFSPSVLSVIKDGPGEKRKFLDIAISLLKPNYAAVLSKYNKAVMQRNNLLKKINDGSATEDFLFAFDEETAKLGGRIIEYRLQYIDSLKEYTADIYKEISNDREKFRLSYVNSLKEKGETAVEWSQILYDELLRKRQSDIARFQTSAGPHKDDIDITLSGRSARAYGSQGQQRSCALAMKIAEGFIIKDRCGEQPVALLDDVMSELDGQRQKCLLKYLEDWQVFVTCCDKAHISKINYGKAFEVCEGTIKQI